MTRVNPCGSARVPDRAWPSAWQLGGGDAGPRLLDRDAGGGDLARAREPHRLPQPCSANTSRAAALVSRRAAC